MSDKETASLQVLAARVAADKRITAEEALELRRAVFPDGVVTRAEAETLIRLNERTDGDDPAWRAAFVEALVDFALLAESPRDHLGDETAAWLEQRLFADAVIERETEMALIVKLLERAETTPAGFQQFARDRLFQLLTAPPPASLKDDDVALIRALLFAVGGADGIAVSREEADWLFAIDSATDGATHCPAWRDLFVRAICNHLMAANAPALLARTHALHRARLAEQASVGLGRRFAQAFSGGLGAIIARARQPDAAAAMNAYYARRLGEMAHAEVLTLSEIAWVTARARADARVTANERAVLDELARIEREQKTGGYAREAS